LLSSKAIDEIFHHPADVDPIAAKFIKARAIQAEGYKDRFTVMIGILIHLPGAAFAYKPGARDRRSFPGVFVLHDLAFQRFALVAGQFTCWTNFTRWERRPITNSTIAGAISPVRLHALLGGFYVTQVIGLYYRYNKPRREITNNTNVYSLHFNSPYCARAA
jgi:hypothetical protein